MQFNNRCVSHVVASIITLMLLVAVAPPCHAEDVAADETAPVAQEAPSSSEEKRATTRELAEASQNPISDIISVALRDTVNFNASPEHNKIQNLFTILPVFPIKLTPTWNIIIRTTIPVLYQPVFAPGGSREFGVSDINITAYVARAESRKVVWGLGPTLLLPTAMEKSLGTGKWSAGPSVAMVASPGNWVLGFLMYNLWSFAGYDDRSSVNQFLLQTFVNYNLPNGWYLCTAPFLAANWKLPNNDRWMVPVGGGVGKVVRTRHVTLDMQTQGFYYVEKPRSEAEWSLIMQLKFLFPKNSKGV